MYDAIVVGARAAGSPTAMLLARNGYHVLAVDRATFPSDTLSPHVVHARGVAALTRWGLLDAVAATGCPPIATYSFDFGAFTIQGRPAAVDGADVAYAPRRTVLDQILVEGARAAGVEVREGTNVDRVLIENGHVVGVVAGGKEERARIVIGADGRNSRVARSVGAVDYQAKPRLQYGFYTYFRSLRVDGLENYIRPGRGFGMAPTNDGLTMVVMGWPYAEAAAFKADVEANFLATMRAIPSVADRLASATRAAPFLGGAVPGWLRTPYGPGWALVGDAGHNKDPITAQGISDAFLDAERCATAVHAWLGADMPYDKVMGAWHAARDAQVLPVYEFTSQLATLEPPPPEQAEFLTAVSRSQPGMDDFASVVAGALSPTEFFADANVARLLAA
jgi:2-polyprenyl-6-methoxyphenol hydroxylase-like FAD-dependent oxidoreductase